MDFFFVSSVIRCTNMEREEEDIAVYAGRDISIQEQTSHGRDSLGRISKTTASIHTCRMMLFLFIFQNRKNRYRNATN